MKPILQILQGEVVPLERVRTASKALGRLEELALASTLGRSVEIAVPHLDAAVVGAHTGPGIVAVVVSPLLAPAV